MPNDRNSRYFWFIIVSETINLILDWDFIYEINQNNDPNVDQSTKHHIFGFAMWGTMLYVFTIVALLRDSCTTSLSLLSTVSEDLPQTCLALYLASRMNHLISCVQIRKAIYGFIEPIIRIIKISNDSMNENDTSQSPSQHTKCQKCTDITFSAILCVSSFVLFMCVMIIP